jgi:FAD/FMN-containing dehydrogenase
VATRTTTSDPLSIPQLRDRFNGQLIGPGDAVYDEARTVFAGGIDRRPALIVRVADASDVAHVVSLARETGLELAVRSGGHSAAGHSVSDGGLVVDLSDMRALEVDLDRRTAWAEAGLTAGQYTDATSVHGLATGFGDTGSVGIGGITLGGGIGYLVRKYGLTVDNLLAAELVTAEGRMLRVDAETHPDLFWAIRGGGGNFGVATRFQYRLHDVDMILGGLLVLPATADTIEGFVAAAHAAPSELSTIANVMPAPPMPFLPPEVHGKLVILATLAYAGTGDAAERAVAPFRALAAPLADMVHPMPYREIYPPEEADYHPIATSRTMFVDTIDDEAARLTIDRLQASTAPMSVAQIRVLGGAMAAVPDDATAFAHRSKPIMVNVAAVYQALEQAAIHQSWVSEFAAALNPGYGAYVNFLGDEGPGRVREAYPGPTWDRLTEIKRRHDPTNLFRLNQNIPPAA